MDFSNKLSSFEKRKYGFLRDIDGIREKFRSARHINTKASRMVLGMSRGISSVDVDIVNKVTDSRYLGQVSSLGRLSITESILEEL
jgi:hypothetical protein